MLETPFKEFIRIHRAIRKSVSHARNRFNQNNDIGLLGGKPHCREVLVGKLSGRGNKASGSVTLEGDLEQKRVPIVGSMGLLDTPPCPRCMITIKTGANTHMPTCDSQASKWGGVIRICSLSTSFTIVNM